MLVILYYTVTGAKTHASSELIVTMTTTMKI